MTKILKWAPCFVLMLSAIHVGASTPSHTVNIRLHSEPPGLDWQRTIDHLSGRVIYQIMEGLVEVDKDLRVVPSLAESWNISKDRMTYTFHVRKDVRWSDGTLLTAQQFVDGFERLFNPKTGAPAAFYFFSIQGSLEYSEGKLTDASKLGLQAKDANTLVIKLKKPAAFFLGTLGIPAAFPIRKELIDKYGDRWTDPEHLVVVGPFKLADWKHGSKLTLVRNPRYHGPRPQIDEADLMVVNEDSVAVNMFEKDMLDLVINLPPLEINQLKKVPGFHSYPFVRGYFYGFNVEKKPFDDKRVRQAFALATDRKQITDLLNGGQIPTTSWVPQGIPGFEPDVGLKFNVQRARELLKAAGYPDGKGFPVITAYFDSRDDNRTVAERLQAMWKENLGITINLKSEDWKSFLSHLKKDAPPIFRLGWGMGYPDPDNFLNIFTSTGTSNYVRWKNTRYDQLIEQGASEANPKKRLVLYKEAQKILLEDEAAFIPLFQESLPLLMSSRISRFQMGPQGKFLIKNMSVK